MTPDNAIYYQAAYAAAAAIYGLYAASLWWRSRAVTRREAQLPPGGVPGGELPAGWRRDDPIGAPDAR